jgi:hypothetical protein
MGLLWDEMIGSATQPHNLVFCNGHAAGCEERLGEPCPHSRPFQASEMPTSFSGVCGFTTSVISDKWLKLRGQQQMQEKICNLCYGQRAGLCPRVWYSRIASPKENLPSMTNNSRSTTRHRYAKAIQEPVCRIQVLGIQERSGRQCRPFDFDGATEARGNRFEPPTTTNCLCITPIAGSGSPESTRANASHADDQYNRGAIPQLKKC